MNVTESTPNAIDLIAEEFVERFRKGERPTVSEYEARFPEQAEAIRDLFPALVVLENLKPATAPMPTTGQAECASEVASLGKLGDYRIVREIGRGGMGIVYEAVQESLGRQVALKVLPKQLMGDSSRQARFEREARAAARLHHTNIVPVFGVGAENGLHYYAMQYIHGLGLDEVLAELKRLQQAGAWKVPVGTIQADQNRAANVAQAMVTGIFHQSSITKAADSSDERNALALSASQALINDEPQARAGDTEAEQAAETLNRSGAEQLVGQGSSSGTHGSRGAYWQSVARIGVQVAEALAYAHGQGIVHRDIKPANLLLDTRGTVWVTDFGLAKAEDQQDLTETGDVLGTLRYMAPEQFHGKGDARSDVYSLGMTLYELLVLWPAYEGTDRAQLVQKVLHETPPKLRVLDPTIPRDLETIVHKSIDREPAHRYPAAGELAADLQRYVGDEPIRARRASPLARLARWCRKHRVVAMLTSLAASLLVLVIVVLADSRIQIQRQRDRFRDALVQSLVLEARFRRTSGEIGQRAESLRNLTEAGQRAQPLLKLTEVGQRDDLRDEVIRCLALHDLDRVAEWPATFPNHSPDSIAFDPLLSHYVSYGSQAVEIRRPPASSGTAGEIVQRLPLGAIAPRVAKFSRDGRLLALRVNDDDHSQLTVWRWRESRRLLNVTGVAERAFDIDRAGERLVCGLRDGTMQTYDLTSGAVLATWTLPNRPFDARFEPDGPFIACSIPEAHCVQIFDSRNGKLAYVLPCGEDIYALAWHPQGDRLAIGLGFNVSIRQFDNSEVASLTGHRWMIHALEYHPSGEFLVSHSLREGVTRLWDVRTRRELLVAPGHFVRFDADGKKLAFVHATTLKLTRLLGEDEYQTLADPRTENVDAWRAIHHPTLPVLVDCGRHGIRCWDLRRRRLLAASPRETVYTACFDLLTGDLLTAGDGGLQRWKLQIDGDAKQASLSPPQRLSFTDGSLAAPTTRAFGLDCTPNGQMRIAAFQDQPHLYVQDVPSGRIRRLPCDPATAFIAVSPSGRWIAAGNHNSSGFQLWDTRQDGAPGILPVNASAGQVAFSPDGEHLIACANDRYVLFKVGTWEVQSETIRPTLIDGAATFSPDSRILAMSMGPHEVQLQEVESGRILATLDSGRDPVNILNVKFHPGSADSLFLACGPYGVRIWDIASVRRKLSELHLDW